MPLHANLLGETSFTYQNQAANPVSKKSLALLAYLCAQTHPSNRDHLAELLWGAGKLSNVRQALYELRQLPGAQNWLDDDNDSININATTDLQHFEDKQKDPDERLKHYHGFLTNLSLNNAPAFTEWLELERSRLNQAHAELQVKHAATLETQGKYNEALKLAKTQLNNDPLNETLHRQIMRLEFKNGNQEAALEQFEQLREKLRDELNVEPLDETLDLLSEIEGGSAGARQAVLLNPNDNVPSSAENFMGRQNLKQNILENLKQNTDLLIQGFGGMGKTALAAEVTQHWLNQQKTALWLEIGSDSFDNSLDALVRPFAANQELAQTQSKKTLIHKLLNEKQVSLIVLDDLRNAYTLLQLSDLLPPNIPLLITSRSRYPRIKRHYLDRLERNESLNLLSHHAQKPLQKNKHADQLANQLGDHAFALRLAGITLNQEQTTPQSLLKRIRQNPFDLKLPPELSEHGKESIATLLNTSLSPLNDAEYEAFLAFGALPAPTATPDLITKLTRRNTEETENALYTLNNRGLAQRQTQAGVDQISYRLHDLAHAYAKTNTALRPQTTHRATLDYLTTHKDNIDAVETELNNLLSAAETSEANDLVNYMRLLTVDGTYYTARGHSNRSIKLLEKAIDKAKEVEDLEAAHYFAGRLGDVHSRFTGNYERALESYQEAHQLAKKDMNTGREAVFLSLIGITKSYLNTDDAQEYMDMAYSKASQTKDILCRCTVLEQRGYFFAQQGQWSYAKPFFEEALNRLLEASESLFKDGSERTRRIFFSYLNLGGVEFDLENYNQTMTYRKRALEIALKSENELWQAHALLEIGELHHALNNKESSSKNLIAALNLYKKNEVQIYVERVSSFMKEKGYA